MKRILIILYLAWGILQAYCQNEKSVTFSYEAIMASAEWQNCLSTTERIKMLQIPEDVIQDLTTKDLLDICLEYPYIADILFKSDFYEVFKNIVIKHLGFQNLLKRENLIQNLLEKDKEIQAELSSFSQKTVKEQGRFALKVIALNMLLYHIAAVGNKTDQQVLTVITNILTQRHLLKIDGENYTPNFNKNTFWGMFAASDDSSLKTQQDIQLRTLPSDYVPTTIYTPFKSIVPHAYTFTGTDIVNSGIYWLMAQQVWEEIYNLTIIGPPTKTYNSHGYAYAWGESEIVWIEGDSIDVYWTDGSYIEVPESEATHVYYVDGNHSALRINSQTYVSKLDSGYLVRHQPNLLPEEYCSTSTKKYYKKATLNCSINGSSHICSPCTFSVSGVPVGCSVDWSIHGPSANDNIIQQDSLGANQCYIDNTNHFYFNDTLIATISKNGQTLTTCKKNIYAYLPFCGTYSQTPEAHNKYNFSPIPETPFSQYNPVFAVNQDCYVTIQSQAFKGKTVTCTNPCTYITLTRIDSETICIFVNYQKSINIVPVNLSASSVEGCDDFNFVVYACNSSVIPLLNPSPQMVSYHGNKLNISFTHNDGEMEADKCNRTNNMVKANWTVSVVNVITGKSVISGLITSEDVVIETASWSKGVYIVMAENGKEMISQKVTIQ